jgi:beta-lactam-binding protein with PASTA domain
VTLFVSTGGCPVQVLDVLGSTVQTAVAALTQSHFVVTQTPAPASLCTNSQLNDVVFQSPKGGSAAPYGSTVTVEFCQSVGPTGATGATGATGVTGATGAAGTTTSTTTTTTTVVAGNHPGAANG